MKLEVANWKTSARSGAANTLRGFTLIEIMVVVAVMGIILAAGAPTLSRMLHKEGFRKTVSDIVDICTAAREQAILENRSKQIEFRPRDGVCQVVGASAATHGWGNLAQSARIDPGTRIQMLDVNMQDHLDDDAVWVNFYPNGTCDELTLILISDRNEQRGIVLETTTGIATVLSESGLEKLRKGAK